MKKSVVLVVVFLMLGITATAFTQQEPQGEEHVVGEPIRLELIADGFTQPVLVTQAPDDSGRLFIVDMVGQIWILMPDGTLLAEPFLDISDRLVELNPAYDERGLLGLAFHPDYAENGRFFVYYNAPLLPSAPDDWDHTNVLSEFQVMAGDPDKGDPTSEAILLEEPWPYTNHNGGTIAFGPDGMLYLSWGDGGRANDTDEDPSIGGHVEDWYDGNAGGNGQDIELNPMGSIMRLDVSTPMTYTVPADNPFVGELGSDLLELQWAYGFRNPYRFSFDRGGANEMFVGDAGQDMWEEIDIAVTGGNYGWNVKEGTHCFDAANPMTVPATCPDAIPADADHPDAGAPLIDPIIELPHSDNPTVDEPERDGLTIIGGHVYRGAELPHLQGRYFFGVWSGGALQTDSGPLYFPGELFIGTRQPDDSWLYDQVNITNMANGDLLDFLLSFGEDNAGNLYVLTTENVGPTGDTGRVWRVEPVLEPQIYLPLLAN
jgi:glucose/arabinose dehydrogenase